MCRFGLALRPAKLFFTGGCNPAALMRDAGRRVFIKRNGGDCQL
jgi:hypothetical protein